MPVVSTTFNAKLQRDCEITVVSTLQNDDRTVSSPAIGRAAAQLIIVEYT